MKKTTLFILFFMLLATACRKQTFDERVMAEVRLFNEKEAPKRQDPYTMFDSMAFDPASRTISYYLTAEGEAETLFPADLVRESRLQYVVNSLQLKAHKEHDMSFRYVYYGKSSGRVLLDATFTPEDYH